MLKQINPVITFIIELTMIWSFGYFGFEKGSTTFAKCAFAIILPVIIILLWSYFAAPKSAHQLSMPYRAIFRCVCFLTASCFLFLCDKTIMAIVVTLFSIITQFASYYLGD